MKGVADKMNDTKMFFNFTTLYLIDNKVFDFLDLFLFLVIQYFETKKLQPLAQFF